MAVTAELSQYEETLARHAGQGDAVAFDRLVESCGQRIYNIAYRLVGNPDDAQDIAQEVFLRVYQALPRFKGDAAFSSWLYRIVVNACYDELKRRRRRPPPLTALESDESLPIEESIGTSESAEDAAMRREQRRLLQYAITRLPEQFRLVLVLYDMQGLSYQEIAEAMRTNIGTVKSRLNRARNMLRELMLAERELFGVKASQNR